MYVISNTKALHEYKRVYRDDDDDRFLYGDSNDAEEAPKPPVPTSGKNHGTLTKCPSHLVLVCTLFKYHIFCTNHAAQYRNRECMRVITAQYVLTRLLESR